MYTCPPAPSASSLLRIRAPAGRQTTISHESGSWVCNATPDPIPSSHSNTIPSGLGEWEFFGFWIAADCFYWSSLGSGLCPDAHQPQKSAASELVHLHARLAMADLRRLQGSSIGRDPPADRALFLDVSHRIPIRLWSSVVLQSQNYLFDKLFNFCAATESFRNGEFLRCFPTLLNHLRDSRW